MSDDRDTRKDTDTIVPRARPEATLARRITQARLSLAWEAIWPAVWPALGVAGLFIGIALLDVFSYLPGWLHAASLAAVACFLGFAIYTGVRTLVWPNRRDAVRRIETASGLDHRPLEALQDKLPDGMTDPTARALWQAHQQQMADRIRNLKVGAPSPGLPARDPWALRAMVVCCCYLSVWSSPVPMPATGWEGHWCRALAKTRTQTAQIEIWVTPAGIYAPAADFPDPDCATIMRRPWNRPRRRSRRVPMDQRLQNW